MSLDVRSLIRSIPDFPKPGIMFRDVTPVFGNGPGFVAAIDWFDDTFLKAVPAERRPTAIAGIESRGFIFGAALAARHALPFVPIRKAGKLPFTTVRAEYALEYGQGVLEIHTDAVAPGARVLLIDDLIATGGTAAASVRLLREIGAEVVGAGFLIDLAFLKGTAKLAGVPTQSLVVYHDENP